MAATTTSRRHSTGKIRYIPLTYNNAESQTSALRLILALMPQWQYTDGKIEFHRFTDGITNTLLKVVNKRPGLSEEEADDDAVLLRAYGKGTDLIIDRDRETQNHELLMQHGLAPMLLARFHNGMLYRFMRGVVTSPHDLRQENVYRGVARRLAQWHAVVPCLPSPREHLKHQTNGNTEIGISIPHSNHHKPAAQNGVENVAPGISTPNVWTVMQKWICALPAATEAQRTRQASLQKELMRVIEEFSGRPGFGENSLVFAHCDLLSGNVILQPRTHGVKPPAVEVVHFIDYEYSTPSPAAFDISNHFAEWGGFDCDYNVLPARSQRREFIREYVHSYFFYLGEAKTAEEEEIEARNLCDEVDFYRGIPGFYWGIWALIQATISQIDFDYAAYAEVRLSEYWAWRDELDGSRAASGREMPLREKRWAQAV